MNNKNEKEFRASEISKLRNNGYTYARIGKLLGISKQRVEDILHSNGKRHEPAFYAVSEKRCVFKGIRKYLNDHRMSISQFTEFTNKVAQSNKVTVLTMSRYLKNVPTHRMSKDTVDAILIATRLDYETAFEEG